MAPWAGFCFFGTRILKRGPHILFGMPPPLLVCGPSSIFLRRGLQQLCLQGQFVHLCWGASGDQLLQMTVRVTMRMMMMRRDATENAPKTHKTGSLSAS